MYQEHTEAFTTAETMEPVNSEKDPGDDALDALMAELEVMSQTSDPETAAEGGRKTIEAGETPNKPLKSTVASEELSLIETVENNVDSFVSLKKAVKNPDIHEQEPEYSFPNENPQYRDYLSFYKSHSSAQLNQLLARMSAKVSPLPGEIATLYESVRAELCAINVAMNEKGNIAPGFRQMVRRASESGGKAFSKVDEIISRDRQVIDLDWVARHQQRSPDAAMLDMFKPDGLDYNEGGKFACQKLKAERKLSMLGLEYCGDLFLSFFRSDEIAKIAKKDFEDRFKILAAIKKKKAGSRCKLEESPEQLRDINTALVLCGGDVKHASCLVRGMGYSEMPLVTLKRRKEWLKTIT